MVIESPKPGSHPDLGGGCTEPVWNLPMRFPHAFDHQAHLYPATLLGEQPLTVISNIHLPPISNGVQTRAQDFPYQIRFLHPPTICHWVWERSLRMTLFLKPESVMHLPASYICKSDRIPGVGIIEGRNGKGGKWQGKAFHV